ncbi:MAG: peptidylprolyl isomerase [Synechococcus sp.]
MIEPTLPDLRSRLGPDGLELLAQHGLLAALIERMLVREITRSIELTDASQQAAIGDFLRQHNVGSPEALGDLIQASGLSEDAFYEQLFRPARMAQIAQEEFGAKAEARFLAQKERLDRVVYSLLRLTSQSQAQELYLRIAHGEANFSDLAGRFSEGVERNTNGVVGPVPLNQAHPTLSEKLRAAKPGMLLEPFSIDRWWVVARLERFSPASFDARMGAQMSMELLQEWLKNTTEQRVQTLQATLTTVREHHELDQA